MASLSVPCVPVSWGELLDKTSILEIKRDRIARPQARANVQREHGLLRQVCGQALGSPKVAALFERLKAVNVELWEIEDAIREQEAKGDFGATFVALARSVYIKNDLRAVVKREINALLDSELIEEKSYASVTPGPAMPQLAHQAPR